MPNGTWTNLLGGNWGLNTNWSGTTIASGNDSSATFNLNITAIRTITLNANYTIAAISFADAGGVVANQYWTLTRSSTNLLTLQSTLGDGIPTITSNVFTYILNGVIAGSNGFRKLGPESSRFAVTTNPISGICYIDEGNIQLGEHGSGTINTLPNITEFRFAGGGVYSGLWYLGTGNFTETRPLVSVQPGGGSAIWNGVGSGFITLNTSTVRDFSGYLYAYTAETLSISPGFDFLTNFPINAQIAMQNDASSARTGTFRFSHDYPVSYDKTVLLYSPTNTSGGTLLIEVNTNSLTDFTGQIVKHSSSNSSSTMTVNLSGTGSDCLVTGRIRNNPAGTASNGTLALSKSGSGIWVLSGDNDYTGVTSVNAGTLRAQSNTALGSASAGDVTLTGGTLRLEGGLSIVKTARTLTFGGGTLEIVSGSGENSFACGPVTLTGNNGIINVENGASLSLNHTGLISGSTGLIKNGDGDLVLPTSANTFTGDFDINAGNVSVGSISNSGSASTWGAGSSPVKIPQNLKVTGTGGSSNRPVMFVGTTPSIESAGSGAVTLSALSQGGGNRTITLKGDNAGDNTFTAPLKESGIYRTMGLNVARGRHASVTLQNGKVLALGGTTNSTALSSCELYDPVTDDWSTTGAMASARWVCDDNAVLLNTGKALVVGGMTTSAAASAIAGCELYDPAAGTWSAAASITTARTSAVATLLNDASGRVLMTGGYGTANTVLNTCQIYTPNAGTGTWATNTPSFTGGRYLHTATLMSNGSVLLVGGWSGSASLNTFQVFDPAGGAGAGSWSTSSTFSANTRYGHIAVPILSGAKVLIAGGAVNSNVTGNAYSSCLTYTVSGGTWSASVAPMNVARYRPTYQTLSNGNILVVGGFGNDGNVVNSAEIYNPTLDTWTLLTDTLASVAGWVASSTLSDGRVLISGGYNTGSTVTSICSTYNPSQTLGLTKAGAGKWILGGGTLSYSGTTTLEAGTLDLGGTSRVLSGGLSMSGGTLQNGSATLETDVTVTTGTGAINVQLVGAGNLDMTGGMVTLTQSDSNTYTGGTTVGAGATLKAVTSVDPSAVSGGKVLGDGIVTVTGTLKTGASSTQRGQLRYGGTVTFNGGSKIYVGGA